MIYEGNGSAIILNIRPTHRNDSMNSVDSAGRNVMDFSSMSYSNHADELDFNGFDHLKKDSPHNRIGIKPELELVIGEENFNENGTRTVFKIRARHFQTYGT